MSSKILNLQNKMKYFYIGWFSYLSMNHGQDQFHVMRSDSSLMTRQKSELVFAVQDASRPLLSVYPQSVLNFFIPEDSEMFIINVAELFSFFQTTYQCIMKND